MLSLSIQINYDYDTNDFFDTQAKKNAMQAVADQVAATINDHLEAVGPVGSPGAGRGRRPRSHGESSRSGWGSHAARAPNIGPPAGR